MSRTTIAVETATRDRLAGRAKAMGGVSLDEALRALLFEHECAEAFARLDADPEQLESYRREAQAWAELDIQIVEQSAPASSRGSHVP